MINKIQKIRKTVENRYKYWKEKEFNSHSIESEIRMSECKHLLLMLDSLQEEPVNEDLEKEIDKWYDSDIGIYKTREQFGKMIHHFTQWQNQKTIDKACELLAKHHGFIVTDKDIEDFRKTLEEG